MLKLVTCNIHLECVISDKYYFVTYDKSCFKTSALGEHKRLTRSDIFGVPPLPPTPTSADRLTRRNFENQTSVSICHPDQRDQIGQIIGLWATFQSLWQQLFCPNLPIFVKVSKSLIFLVKSFLGNFYKHLATFYWSH